jgi:hypothetical protein
MQKGCQMTRRKDPAPDSAEILPEPPVGPLVSEPVDLPPESMPDPAPVTDPKPAPPRRSGILGPILGGALAALGGFAISHFNLFGYAAPDRSAEMTGLIEKLDATLTVQATALNEAKGELSSITDRITALESAPPPEIPDLSPLADLDRRLDAIETLAPGGDASTAALAAKLAQLEQRLATLPATGENPAIQAELEAALARLTAAEAEAQDRATAAEAATDLATRGLALDALSAAVAEGRPFAAELATLADPALTQALSGMADAGVPSLETLQADFPEAAREVLRLARASDTDAGWGARLVDFLAAQTGARSVTPREGADPDAVLSRAEFALSEGRIADALTELQALEPAVRAPLETWISGAETRVKADAALSAARGE